MKILSQQSKFTSMLQDGPLAVREEPPYDHPFSRETKKWVWELHRDPLHISKYRAVRNQTFDFLGISTFDDILVLLHNAQLREDSGRRARELLANMFGLDGSEQEVSRQLADYARTADDAVNYLRTKILRPYSSHIEMTNEIGTVADPVELLLIVFNDRYHRKARFEAKRKLMLMNLAGSIDQRERETNVEHKFSEFLVFLNEHVWSPSLKIGDLEISYLVSRHDPGDFSCTRVQVIAETEALRRQPVQGEKLTLIKRRRFPDHGRDVPVYVSIRKKPPAAKVLKLLRKNEKNPATAVDDELGLMAVLNSVGDVKRFVRHLTRSAVRAGSFMTLEDISDTLTGGSYHGNATGSSSRTSMLKFFARLGGMRVEFIIHTNRSYLNYMYQRDVSHDEYEVKRIFDSGVAEFLFPPDIYHLNLAQIRERQIRWCRKQSEEY